MSRDAMSNNKKQNPYLSIVIYTRNDGYGGRRHEAGIKGILLQAEKHHLRSELIMVEWNPPPDRPLLKDVFPWPQHLNCCTIRTIVVPASIHERYEFSDKYPVNGPVAFNVGFRRARGEFVLSTTPDILFSDEIIKFLASEKLDKEAMYGIDMHHVRGGVALRSTLEEQLINCQRAIRGVSHVGTFDFGSTEAPILQKEGCGDFILLPRERWNLIHGYPEIDVTGGNCGDLLVHMAYVSGARDVILREPMRVYHMDHDTARSNRVKILRLLEAIYARFNSWFNWPKRLAHISRILGLLVYYPLYKLFPPRNKLDEMEVTSLSYAQSRDIISEMVKGKRSYIFNDENWGLGQESLEEFIINTADWEKEYERNR